MECQGFEALIERKTVLMEISDLKPRGQFILRGLDISVNRFLGFSQRIARKHIF
jgi:hypothetical protein